MGAREQISARWWGGSWRRRPPYTYAHVGDTDLVYTRIAPCATLLNPPAITAEDIVEMCKRFVEGSKVSLWLPFEVYGESPLYRAFQAIALIEAQEAFYRRYFT